jgi:hypothetical protein
MGNLNQTITAYFSTPLFRKYIAKGCVDVYPEMGKLSSKNYQPAKTAADIIERYMETKVGLDH